MILVDTAIWVDHFHRPDPELEQLLRSRHVLVHPFVIGEVAMGGFQGRTGFIDYLSLLRRAKVARDEEVLQLIEDWRLYGCGIGYGDAQLLASVLLTPGSRLWTRDRALRKVARELAVDAGLP